MMKRKGGRRKGKKVRKEKGRKEEKAVVKTWGFAPLLLGG